MWINLRIKSPLVGGVGQIFSTQELKAAFSAIAADHLLDGNVLVGLDLIPDRARDRFTQVFQGLLLPWRIVPRLHEASARSKFNPAGSDTAGREHSRYCGRPDVSDRGGEQLERDRTVELVVACKLA